MIIDRTRMSPALLGPLYEYWNDPSCGILRPPGLYKSRYNTHIILLVSLDPVTLFQTASLTTVESLIWPDHNLSKEALM